MERVKNEATGKPRWKKIGGGSLRIGKLIIKPGQVFEANPEEISPAFRSLVMPVSGDATFANVTKLSPREQENAPAPEEIKKLEYSIRPKGVNKLWFDVVDSNGKPINEKSLKIDMAEKLLADLLK